MTLETTDWKNLKVLVVGMARSGLAATRLSLSLGAHVIAADSRKKNELGETATLLSSWGVELVLGPHDQELLRKVDLVVVSPGVPLSSAFIQAAIRAKIPVWAEVELASRFLNGKIIGVTGTNGKSTITSLIGCLCEKAGYKTFTGGNLGTPLSEAALYREQPQILVCELSSYQLEGIVTFRPQVACVSNLTPDHIDRYPNFQAYGAAKKRIFMNQTENDFGVVNAGDYKTIEMVGGEQCQVVDFGFGTARSILNSSLASGARYDGQSIWVKCFGSAEEYQVRNRALRGKHNIENAMAAILCARLAGVEAQYIQAGMDAFPGLAHRLEYVGNINSVEYINDSKATNVDSAIVALQSFNKAVWLILGGRGKKVPYTPLVELSRRNVRAVLTIGEDAQVVESAFQSVVEVISCGDLGRAIEIVFQRASPGEVVLFSPACASFDQYRNYEERGNHFKMLVKSLPGFSRQENF